MPSTSPCISLSFAVIIFTALPPLPNTIFTIALWHHNLLTIFHFPGVEGASEIYRSSGNAAEPRKWFIGNFSLLLYVPSLFTRPLARGRGDILYIPDFEHPLLLFFFVFFPPLCLSNLDSVYLRFLLAIISWSSSSRFYFYLDSLCSFVFWGT